LIVAAQELSICGGEKEVCHCFSRCCNTTVASVCLQIRKLSSGNSNTIILHRERERESERDRGEKLEMFTLDLGKVARVMSRSTHQRRTLFEEKGETNAELSVRRLCGRGEIWVCMSPYTQHLG